MAEVAPGAAAPVADVAPAPGALPVTAPDIPAGQENAEPNAGNEPVKPTRTFTEEEHRKGISERLAKERRRMERTIRAEMERDFYKNQVESGGRPREESRQPKGAPKPEDYGNDYEAYVVARAKYELKQELSQEQERSRTETAAQQRAREDAEEARDFHDKVFSKGLDKYGPEFEDAIRGNVPFTRAIANALVKLPNGHDVAFHLANNVAEAVRIANLSAVEQVWEVKDLSAKLSAPPQRTQTPPPIVPNAGNAASKKDWAQMSTAEHIETWNKRKR